MYGSGSQKLSCLRGKNKGKDALEHGPRSHRRSINTEGITLVPLGWKMRHVLSHQLFRSVAPVNWIFPSDVIRCLRKTRVNQSQHAFIYFFSAGGGDDVTARALIMNEVYWKTLTSKSVWWQFLVTSYDRWDAGLSVDTKRYFIAVVSNKLSLLLRILTNVYLF